MKAAVNTIVCGLLFAVWVPPVTGQSLRAVTALPDTAPPHANDLHQDHPADLSHEVLLEEPFELAVGWESSVEFGANGSEGNSQVFNLRVGVDSERRTDDTILTLDLDYKKDSTNSTETVNRLFFEGRHEWLFGDSPWSLYILGTAEYDEFRAFDTRLATNAGVGYAFWDDEITTLIGRTGAGVSHEIGGPDDSYPAEASFGMEFSRKLFDRQKFSLSVDYYPEFRNFANSRIVSKADWEVLLDEAAHLSLKLGVIDRYDSTPGGAKHNDFDYLVVLLWKL